MCLIETWKTRGQVVFSRVMGARLESTQLAAHLSLQHVSKMGHFFRFFADCFDSHHCGFANKRDAYVTLRRTTTTWIAIAENSIDKKKLG